MDETAVARPTAQYPPADITPDEFEDFVTELFSSVRDQVDDLKVTPREKIVAPDGTYVFDATVRFKWGGMAFLVLVEAKRYKDPVKRELVQVLHQKVHSVGAHKAVMISTAPYQSGALKYATVHGIALATVTEGRFTLETRGASSDAPMSREAAARLGVETFVGHAYGDGDQPGSIRTCLLSPQHPKYVAEYLLDVSSDGVS